MKPEITAFYDTATNSVSYVVADPQTKRSAIIDSVLDYDPAGARISTGSADQIAAFVRERGLHVEWILETHVHADHLTAAAHLKEKLGGRTGIGRRVTEVQAFFKTAFNAEPAFATDGSQFDRLFEDGERFAIGGLAVEVLATLGHTPACVAYVVGDAAFVGDTLFMPDQGTARADFPGGDARALYRSIRRILALPPATRIFVCHNYGADGKRPVAWETSVGLQRQANIHVADAVSEDDYVAMRKKRDATLGLPRLILPAVQVNMRAGRLPPPDSDGRVYLRLPVNVF